MFFSALFDVNLNWRRCSSLIAASSADREPKKQPPLHSCRLLQARSTERRSPILICVTASVTQRNVPVASWKFDRLSQWLIVEVERLYTGFAERLQVIYIENLQDDLVAPLCPLALWCSKTGSFGAVRLETASKAVIRRTRNRQVLRFRSTVSLANRCMNDRPEPEII